LRSSFFDAFSDIGSHAAKTFLEAKLKRAAGDQAAIQLRSETDGQSLELVSNLQVEEIELERRAKRARLLREIAADERATAADEEATAMFKERTARAIEIVGTEIAARSAEVTARGVVVFNQIHALQGLDDRERVALRARATTALLGVEQAQPARCEVNIENFLREHHSGASPSAFGRKAAAIWNTLHPGERHPKKRIILGNGQAVDVNIYYTDDIEPVLLPALQQCG
jgi:hypothetical protein